MLRINTTEPLQLTQRPLELTPHKALPGMERARPDSIEENLTYRGPAKKLILQDVRRTKNAIDHVKQLPLPGEALHLVVDGRFEPCDLIPDVCRLSATKHIKSLTVTTLGLNPDNVWTIAQGMDQEQINEVSILVSHYFKSADADEYAYLKKEIEGRGGKVNGVRTHAKIMLLEMIDGECYTIEGSGNMRSCQSIEQFVITNDRALLEFHRNWIESYLDTLGDGKETHLRSNKTQKKPKT